MTRLSKKSNFKTYLVESKIKTFPLNSEFFRVERKAILGTIEDLKEKKRSYSTEPVEGVLAGSGQFILFDGYHRFLEALIIGKKSLKVKIDDSLLKYYKVFDLSEAWDFDLSKLVSDDELEELRDYYSKTSVTLLDKSA